MTCLPASGLTGTATLWPGQLSGEELVPLKDGDGVDLVRPLQGGHVLFIGAFVRGVPVCSEGSLKAELKRLGGAGQPGAGPIVVYDARTVSMVAAPAATAPDAAGWAQSTPDNSDVANVPVCPNGQPYDLVDAPLWVQVTYSDRSGNALATAGRQVTPRCGQQDALSRAQCQCECRANYSIDRCLMQADGGAADGADH